MQSRRALPRIQSRPNFFQARFEFPEVRTGPIDLATFGTATEIVVMNLRERLELLKNIGFLHALQEAIALQAAGEGCRCAG